VLADGSMVVLVHEPNEEVSALVPYTFTNAAVERVAVLPGSGAEDRVYLYVRRGAARCLERFAMHGEAQGGTLNKVMDGHVVTAAPTTVVSGLGHPRARTSSPGATGAHWRPGIAARRRGAVTCPSPRPTSPWGCLYRGAEDLKLAYASQRGTSLAQQKRVGPIGLVMNDVGWAGVRLGRDFDHLTSLPRTYRGRPLRTDEVLAEWDQAPAALNGGWGSDPRICIAVVAPYPCTILGIVFGEQVNEGEDVPAPSQR
jgi:hypothetical protein